MPYISTDLHRSVFKNARTGWDSSYRHKRTLWVQCGLPSTQFAKKRVDTFQGDERRDLLRSFLHHQSAICLERSLELQSGGALEEESG